MKSARDLANGGLGNVAKTKAVNSLVGVVTDVGEVVYDLAKDALVDKLGDYVDYDESEDEWEDDYVMTDEDWFWDCYYSDKWLWSDDSYSYIMWW